MRAVVVAMAQDGPVSIRAPNLSDIDGLVDLWTTLVRSQAVYGANIVAEGNEDVARQYFGRMLLEDGVRVAVAGGRFVGFVSFKLEPDQFDCKQRVGLVENLFVKSGYRRRGIGTRLLEVAEDALHNRGAETVHLDVLVANRAARSFYEGHGYEPQRVRYAKDVETDKDNGAAEE